LRLATEERRLQRAYGRLDFNEVGWSVASPCGAQVAGADQPLRKVAVVVMIDNVGSLGSYPVTNIPVVIVYIDSAADRATPLITREVLEPKALQHFERLCYVSTLYMGRHFRLG